MGPEPAIDVLEKYNSMEQLILSFAQLLSSNLESRYRSHIPSNFMNLGNNQELEVNEKGLSGEKIDVMKHNFISVTTHSGLFSLHRATHSYIQFLCLKERMKKITRKK